MASIELEITVLNADSLPEVPTRLRRRKLNCNTFVQLQYADNEFKTKIIKHNRSPNYSETFKIILNEPISRNSKPIDVRVIHDGRLGKDLVGKVMVPVRSLPGTRLEKKYYRLQGPRGPAGRINLQLKYNDPQAAGRHSTTTSNANGITNDETGDTIPSAEVEKNVEMQKANDSLVRAAPTWSSKPAPFQIRVKIIQARALQADHSIDPIVKVTIGDMRKRTRKKRSSFNPWYNEILYFDFFEPPQKLFEKFVEFGVSNSRSIRRDTNIGTFRLDLGLVRQQDNHAFTRKWLMLADANDPSAGVKGYLKITISALAEGEEAPTEDETLEEDEDLEANMLRPLGIASEPCDLVVKIFRGSNMPRTDVSFKTNVGVIDKIIGQDKDQCDPYVAVSFSGKSARTAVKSNTYNPEWMQEVALPAMLPSMCDGLTFRVRDSDIGFWRDSDDTIGTYRLPLGQVSHSSGSDSGFLPCFGPAYINLYGASRSFHLFNSSSAEDLNDGIGEGVAYRGRILVELKSQPGGDPDREDAVVDLPPYERERADLFASRQEYKLKVELVDCNMISSNLASGPFQIELSMGLYGNTEETEVVEGTSVTVREQVLSDGSSNKFVGWDIHHPVLELTSGLMWEDISYRIESANFYKRRAHHFEKVLIKFEKYIAERQKWDLPNSNEDVNIQTRANNAMYFLIIHSLKDYVAGLNVPLPSLPSDKYTKLDYSLYDLRATKRREAIAAAKYVRSHDAHPQLKDGTAANPGGLDQQLKTQGFDALGEDLLTELKSLHQRLIQMAFDPQISLPDIMLWAMCDGKRMAYLRIPAADIYFHPNESFRGIDFGEIKTKFLKLPKRWEGKSTDVGDIPGQLQFRAWFGPAMTEESWTSNPENVKLIAETYENQRFVTSWGAPLATDRPGWSDRFGKLSRPRGEEKIPIGYKWESKWNLQPAIAAIDPDASLNEMIEEIFENQRWYPIKGWGTPTTVSSLTDDAYDVVYQAGKGKLPSSLEAVIDLRPGWIWAPGDLWRIDHSRPGDPHGWQYSSGWRSNFEPIKEKHVVRRRRWIRRRIRDESPPQDLDTLKEASAKDGWEYNFSFSNSRPYHSMKRKIDFVRRRRWRRVASEDPLDPRLYDLDDDPDALDDPDASGSDDDSNGKLVNRQQFLADDLNSMYFVGKFNTFEEAKEDATFELRCHIYQGRNLLAEDENGLSDPFVRVTFGHRSGCTNVQKMNLSPTWDHTVVLGGLVLHGGHKARINICLAKIESLCKERDEKLKSLFNMMASYEDQLLYESKKARIEQEYLDQKELEFERMMSRFPRLVLEVYDRDPHRNEYLGRTIIPPANIKCRSRKSVDPPVLDWFDITRHENAAGQVLCAFEIIPSGDASIYPLPKPFAAKRESSSDQYIAPRIPLPDDIRPVCELVRVDVLAWGLRNLKSFRSRLRVACPHISLECGGSNECTPKLRDTRTRNNFGNDAADSKYCIVSLEVLLPINLRYCPALNIRLYDNRKFGRKPLLGVATIPNARDFMEKPDEIDSACSRWLDVEPDTVQTRTRLSTLAQLNGEANVRDMMMNELHQKKKEKALSTKRSLHERLLHPSRSAADPEFIDDTVDWWTKYFNSPNATGAAHRTKRGSVYKGNKLRIFPAELEHHSSVFEQSKVFRYVAFDTIKQFTLMHGKERDSKTAGVFKGDVAVFNANTVRSETVKWNRLPSQDNVKCAVRLYAVKAHNLVPKDLNGRSDPYVKITLNGKTVIDDRKNYVKSTLNPVFGKCFEFTAEVPLETDLSIAVYDYDTLSRDDIIGATTIDLEDRLLSRCRPTCGLPQIYSLDSPDPWRDQYKPFELLQQHCVKYNFPSPKMSVIDRDLPWDVRPVPTISVGRKVFYAQFENSTLEISMSNDERYRRIRELWKDNLNDEDECELLWQNAALRALHSTGYTPEHIETRTLYSRTQPGFIQGKLEMWLDVFPLNDGPETTLPEPVDISPRIPDEYELRIVVRNVDEVILDETNIAGERMSDLYVKSFLRGMENQRQKTDVHYRSLNGEGNFNWRLKHKFLYLPSEDNIVVKRRASAFSWNKEEIRIPATLCLQIWDNDLFSKDDFLGEVELRLSDFIKPERMSHNAILYRDGDYPIRPDGSKDTVNLFRQRRATGWFATKGFERQNPEYEVSPDGLRKKKLIMAGKIEVEIELLTVDEATAKPSGFGRSEPNQFPHLEKPHRPGTSFSWFTSPFKALWYILWKNYWKYILALILIIIGLVYLILYLYHAPYFLGEKSFESTNNE